MSTKESKLNYEDYQYILIAVSLARENDDIKEMPQIDEYLSELYVKVKALYNKEVTRMNREQQDKDQIGRGIRLIYTDDRYTRLTNGDLGTITYISFTPASMSGEQQVSIRWDIESNLALITGKDQFRILDKGE